VKGVNPHMFAMAIDYDNIRAAVSPNGLIELLSALGHEPEIDWDGMSDLCEVLLDNKQPAGVRKAISDEAITIRQATSLVGEQKGIECYMAILRPGLTLSSATCRNLSHAFRHVSNVTRMDETFLFIGTTKEDHDGDVIGDTLITEWATIHLARVYRKAGAAEELRLARLDWKPTKKSRHTLDCLQALHVTSFPGQVEDDEVVRFREKVKDWFNKERLSRRFFKEFYRRFENALDLVQHHASNVDYEPFKPSKNKPVTSYNKKDRETDPNREIAAKFLLKQALRMLFLHFLQEKEWLCKDKNFLLNQWRQYEKSTRSIANYDATQSTGFHQEVLIPLFFETLNQRRPDDASDNWGPTRWDKGERSLMPYLNGGIFDIDKVVDHWDFDAEKPMFLIPDAVFSADRDYEPALDDESLSGRQVNMLAFLDDYHFTIAEDTPVDEAVALDPELMGKIFENLLVSRHSDGAYYTPRSIVRFQCKDTLARYLEEQLADIGGLDHDWFLTLFDLDRDFSDRRTWDEELFTPVVADRIEAALKECKVLDPAVGSGAYLLGMLTEMLRLRQLCHMVRTGHMVDRGSIEFYRWKSEIIRDSLYGVDINPEAVAICHLRLWLAMVVDQDRDSASPLPNLDFQVTAGDSLRDSVNGHRIFVAPGQEGQSTLWSYMGGEDEDGPNDEPIKARIKRILELRHEYYDENASPSKRDGTRAELQKLRQQMMLEGLDQLEHHELKKLRKSNMNAIKRDRAENDVIAKFNDTRKRINEGTFTSLFSYEAIFGDVFQREGRSGFDIIVGNPPYLEDEGTGGYDDIQKLLGLKSNNLYAMFWIRSIRDLSRPGGQVSFITSDTFLTIGSHQETRSAMLKESRIHYVIQAGNWFFTFNNAWTAILTVTTRGGALSEDSVWNDNEIMIAYDITKLPSRDLSALDKALNLWKPGPESRARTSDINSELIDAGDATSWYLQLEESSRSYIGRYAYPLGLTFRNSNVPLFHACPKLFKLIWDVGPWKPVSKSNLLLSNGEGNWRDYVPRTIIEFNGKEIELVKLKEVADVKVGMQTGDDKHYLRKVPEARGSMEEVDTTLILTPDELNSIRTNPSTLSSVINNGINIDQFGGRCFVPYAKPPKQSGGQLNMFWCPVEYYIDWSTISVNELKTFTMADAKRRKDPSFIGSTTQEKERAAVLRNTKFYFKDVLNFSMAGEQAPVIWKSWGAVSSDMASILTSDYIQSNDLLAITSSHFYSFGVKAFFSTIARVKTDSMRQMPIPLIISDYSLKIEELINRCSTGDRIRSRFDEDWLQISNSVSNEYCLIDSDLDELNLWTTRRYSRPGVIE
jgi:hypothetical protein